MKGRRLPLTKDGKIPAMRRWKPGDYCGPLRGTHGVGPGLRFCLPILGSDGERLFGTVHGPQHSIRECPDGSLEVRGSIRFYDRQRGMWHGWLDEGHNWNEVEDLEAYIRRAEAGDEEPVRELLEAS